MTIGELKLYLDPLPDDLPAYREDSEWGPAEIQSVHITNDVFYDGSGNFLVGVLFK